MQSIYMQTDGMMPDVIEKGKYIANRRRNELILLNANFESEATIFTLLTLKWLLSHFTSAVERTLV